MSLTKIILNLNLQCPSYESLQIKWPFVELKGHANGALIKIYLVLYLTVYIGCNSTGNPGTGHPVSPRTSPSDGTRNILPKGRSLLEFTCSTAVNAFGVANRPSMCKGDAAECRFGWLPYLTSGVVVRTAHRNTLTTKPNADLAPAGPATLSYYTISN